VRRRITILVGVVVVLPVLAAFLLDRPPVLEIAPGADLQAALDAAPAGAVVELAPGRHPGPVVVRKELTLRGAPGALVVAPRHARAAVGIASDDVTLGPLGIRGGSSGLIVRDANDVRVDGVTVRDSVLHGVEIVDASAHLFDVEVAALSHPMAQGIEVRNSDGRPDTLIEHSSVSGGQEGIVSHVSEVVVVDNVISGTTMRGITITEMSDGVVARNQLTGLRGAALYCGDMSRCEFSENVAPTVARGDLGRSTEGWGLVVTYHAVASTEEDQVLGASGAILTSIGGHLRNDSPLDPRASLGAFLPIALATASASAALLLAFLALRPFASRLDRVPRRSLKLVGGPALGMLALAGLGVQTFHMVEHALQVFRVRIDQIPSRGGIVGPRVEAEWVHFTYNALVLAGVVLFLVARSRGWRPPGRVVLGDRFLLVAVAAQGYHFVEHSAKLAQHIQTGAKVNQGLVGGFVDLVLLHFAINLTVYLAMVAAAIAYAPPSRLGGRLRVAAPGRARALHRA
jgi:nitrous oxidase accessory protein NosD